MVVSLVVLEASVGAANKVGPSCKKDILSNWKAQLFVNVQSSKRSQAMGVKRASRAMGKSVNHKSIRFKERSVALHVHVSSDRQITS